jgi:hypothetical protein
MASSPPNLGHDLYRIVPEVYRNRDESGDLKAFFGGCGQLLDLVCQTLVQKLADQYPDNPDGGLPGPDTGLPCQEWLLPYFADLLDVRLVSPLAEGRRDEISNAIAWRQRKGTLAVIEQISEQIGLRESVLHEGWKRVAMTPRIGKPLLPATAYGYSADPPSTAASLAARHPGLPAVTVDFRCSSGAVETRADGQHRRHRPVVAAGELPRCPVSSRKLPGRYPPNSGHPQPRLAARTLPSTADTPFFTASRRILRRGNEDRRVDQTRCGGWRLPKTDRNR